MTRRTVQVVSVLTAVMSTPNPLSLALIFCFGTLIGSFVNVCIGRLQVGKSIVWPSSACTACGVPLQWWQNVPIVSYLALGARCHYCGSPIGVRYLLLEVLTGAVAGAVFWTTGKLDYAFFYYFTFSCLLIIVFFVDLDAWIILDEINYFGIVCGIAGAWLLSPPFGTSAGLHLQRLAPGTANVIGSAVGAMLGYGFFYGIAILGAMLARQEAMGRGDVKFAAMIGAFLGPQHGFIALVLAFPLGAVFALPLMFFRGKGGKTPIPFGTFMAAAAFAMVVGWRWVDGWLMLWPMAPTY